MIGDFSDSFKTYTRYYGKNLGNLGGHKALKREQQGHNLKLTLGILEFMIKIKIKDLGDFYSNFFEKSVRGGHSLTHSIMETFWKKVWETLD